MPNFTTAWIRAMSNDRIAKRAGISTARRLSKPVTFTPRAAGEFGSSDDPTRRAFTVYGIYTSASDAPDLDAPGGGSRVNNRVVLAQDEIDLDPDVARFLPWRPKRADHVTVNDAAGTPATFPVASVYPDGQGGLRIVLDRRSGL